MIRAIGLSLAQLFHPATLRVLLLVAVITAGLFIVLGGAMFALLDRWVLPAAGQGDSALAAVLGIGTALLAGWFLFRAVAMAVAGLFTDRVVDAVERDDYPAAAASARPIGFMAGLRLGLRSALRAVGWNLLALPAYVALLVTGVGTLVLVVAVNTLILGRDFEEMVAARHPDRGPRPLRAADRLLLGLATSVMFIIPFANLAAPLFGASLAVHLFHRPTRNAS